MSNAKFAVAVIILGYNGQIGGDTSCHHYFVQHSLLLLSVHVTALVKSVHELNVYAFCSVVFLAIGGHHKFKEICHCFFLVIPDLTLSVAYGSDFV